MLVLVSRYGGGDVLAWSVDGVGLMIAYYYGQTGIACVVYYRRYIFKSVKNFIFVGLLPLIGGLIARVHLRVGHQGLTPNPATRTRELVRHQPGACGSGSARCSPASR